MVANQLSRMLPMRATHAAPAVAASEDAKAQKNISLGRLWVESA